MLNLLSSQSTTLHHEHDPVFLALLRIAVPTSLADFSSDLEQVKSVLNKLADYVSAHWRIIPLLRNKAQKLGIFNDLEPQVQVILNEYTTQGIVSELAKQALLQEIIREFSQNKIPVILLKSTAFNQWLYSSEAPRLSNDIDLLVKTSDWEKATQCLSKFLVYQPKKTQGILDDTYEMSFRSVNNNSIVDIHKALIHPSLFNINEKSLWETSISHPIYKTENVRMLSPQNALYHNALHSVKDLDFLRYSMIDCHLLIQHLNNKKDDFDALPGCFNEKIPLRVLIVEYNNFVQCTQSEKHQHAISQIRLIMIRWALALSEKERTQGTFSKFSKPLKLLSAFAFSSNILGPLKLISTYLCKGISRKSNQYLSYH